MKLLNRKDCLVTSLNKFLLCIFVTLTFIGCDDNSLADDEFSRPVRKLIDQADKLLLTKGRSPDFFSVEPQLIQQLSESIEIVSFKNGYACMCDAEIFFYVYRGDKLLMALGHHHDGSLRWFDAKWQGDAVLSDESLERLVNWRRKAFALSNKIERGSYTPPSLE